MGLKKLTAFRVQLIAAPLKRGDGAYPGDAGESFRVQLIAAPLKPV